MTDIFSHLALQQYWWIIISTIGSALVFLLFVQGGQTLIYSLAKNEDERNLIINSIGRKWEFSFTTLVVFGGAFFAAFPLFYSTSFGGAYWVWMTLLFTFILQPVSYHYRSKPNNFFGAKTYETFLQAGGYISTFLLGVIVATLFTGSPFVISDMKEMSWMNDARGLELLLNPHNLVFGIAILFLTRVLAILYIVNSVDDKVLIAKARKRLIYEATVFVVAFLTFVIWLMFIQGYAVNPENGTIYLLKNKYFINLIEMPIVLIMFVVGVALVLTGVIKTIFTESDKGIWWSGFGTFITALSLFMIAGFNNTAFYPSSYDIQSSLTIQNASSSQYTLMAMFYVSLMIPIVLGYIWLTWRAINKHKITREELESEDTNSY